jgi:hypothetical protein
MLQQRLTQASLLAQSQASPASTTGAKPSSIADPTSSSSSNLRKRKSMASLSIVAPRELEHPDSNPPSAHLFSPSRPSTFRSPGGPGSPNAGLRSPSASTAAGMQVLNSIASRRRESHGAAVSPRNGPPSAGPRVAFAYPRSPSGGPVVRSPGRGRYISSSGSARFETSAVAEGTAEEDEMEGDEVTSPRKRSRGLTRPAVSLQRKPSVTLMPAFGSNTIYGIQRDPEENASPNSAKPSRKPRSASHSVETRPFVARNILTGYQRVESPTERVSLSQGDMRREMPSTLRMPYGTDESDLDAANGLMSMLGSAPASFNPSRNAPVMPSSGPGHHLRAPKPRAASFAAILTSTGGFARPHRVASPTRARRFQQDRPQPSPNTTKRPVSRNPLADEHASACATSSSSSDEENLKASQAASASDEDQQAAEAILFLAASPSPAITHSSPAKASIHRATTTKIGRVLFDETDEADSARRQFRNKPYPSLPSSVIAQQKRPAIGESPLQQPPINNASPSRDRFSRTLPARTLREEATPALPATAPLEPGMDETSGVTLPEPTQLLSPPDSDHSKP